MKTPRAVQCHRTAHNAARDNAAGDNAVVHNVRRAAAGVKHRDNAVARSEINRAHNNAVVADDIQSNIWLARGHRRARLMQVVALRRVQTRQLPLQLHPRLRRESVNARAHIRHLPDNNPRRRQRSRQLRHAVLRRQCQNPVIAEHRSPVCNHARRDKSLPHFRARQQCERLHAAVVIRRANGGTAAANARANAAVAAAKRRAVVVLIDKAALVNRQSHPRERNARQSHAHKRLAARHHINRRIARNTIAKTNVRPPYRRGHRRRQYLTLRQCQRVAAALVCELRQPPRRHRRSHRRVRINRRIRNLITRRSIRRRAQGYPRQIVYALPAPDNAREQIRRRRLCRAVVIRQNISRQMLVAQQILAGTRADIVARAAEDNHRLRPLCDRIRQIANAVSRRRRRQTHRLARPAVVTVNRKTRRDIVARVR